MKKTIKVLIADDHAIVRAGISTVLGLADGIEIVGEAANGKLAARKAKELHPDVVIMDLMMPVMDGVEATKAVVAENPETKVLILTTDPSSNDIVQALNAGASGVVIKTASNTSLVAAIRAVAAGKRPIPSEVEQRLMDDTPSPELTDRQREILESITKGLPNKQIAHRSQEDRSNECRVGNANHSHHAECQTVIEASPDRMILVFRRGNPASVQIPQK